MHSQPAASFNRKRSSVLVAGILFLFCFIGCPALIMNTPGTWGVASAAVLCIAGILLLVRTILVATKPYLYLTDRQVTVTSGLIPVAKKYPLIDIQSAHTNRPETYIELIGSDAGTGVRIDLHPLDKADRIRFIFLVESSINRKFHV
jgi:hypothetical protein